MSPAKVRITREVSLEELKQRYRREKDPRVKIRLHMLLRIQDGASARQVAREHHSSHSAVSNWVQRFNEEGFRGLIDRSRQGRPAKITEQELKELLALPPSHYGYDLPAWTPRAIRVVLQEQFGINYSLASIYDVIKRCHFSLITPRSQHYKQDPEKVKAFKKT